MSCFFKLAGQATCSAWRELEKAMLLQVTKVLNDPGHEKKSHYYIDI